MTLSEIIKAGAARMTYVTVDCDSSQSTVCISDDCGVQEDIFMQGDDADKFCDEVDKLYEEAGDVTRTQVELHLAEQYVDCIWS